jgi:hypothetical protein
MTTDELRAATREFDQPIPAAKLRPISKAERARFERSRRQGISHGSLPPRTTAPLVADIDPELLTRIQKYAVEHQMTLSDFVAKSLQSSLTFVGG